MSQWFKKNWLKIIVAIIVISLAVAAWAVSNAKKSGDPAPQTTTSSESQTSPEVRGFQEALEAYTSNGGFKSYKNGEACRHFFTDALNKLPEDDRQQLGSIQIDRACTPTRSQTAAAKAEEIKGELTAANNLKQTYLEYNPTSAGLVEVNRQIKDLEGDLKQQLIAATA